MLIPRIFALMITQMFYLSIKRAFQVCNILSLESRDHAGEMWDDDMKKILAENDFANIFGQLVQAYLSNGKKGIENQAKWMAEHNQFVIKMIESFVGKDPGATEWFLQAWVGLIIAAFKKELRNQSAWVPKHLYGMTSSDLIFVFEHPKEFRAGANFPAEFAAIACYLELISDQVKVNVDIYLS